MRISTTQFSLNPLEFAAEFWQRLEVLLIEAHQQQSELICLPEYFAVSYALKLAKNGNFRERLAAFTSHLPEFKVNLQTFSDQYKLAIVAGSVPVVENQKMFNRSFVFRPQVAPIHQDKIHMTRFETEEWKISPGRRQLNCFHWHGRLCAVVVCYDIEFARISQALVHAGVDLVLVPSCTDTEQGYWRVRHCAAARAIEGQLACVMSSTVQGDATYSEIDKHFGQGVVLSPCDGVFPPDGVLALGQLQVEGQITTQIDFAAIESLRQDGAVFNLHDAQKFLSDIELQIESKSAN